MSGKSYKKQWRDPDEILEILFSSRLDELGDLEESIDVGNHEDNDSDEYDDDDDYEEKESEPSSETLQIKTTEEKLAPDAELVLTLSQSESTPARSDVVDFRKQKQNENFSLDGTLDIAMDSDNDLPGFSGGAGYLVDIAMDGDNDLPGFSGGAGYLVDIAMDGDNDLPGFSGGAGYLVDIAMDGNNDLPGFSGGAGYLVDIAMDGDNDLPGFSGGAGYLVDIAMDGDNDLPGFSGGAGYLDPVVSSNTENIFYDSDHDSLNNEPVNPETDAVLRKLKDKAVACGIGRVMIRGGSVAGKTRIRTRGGRSVQHAQLYLATKKKFIDNVTKSSRGGRPRGRVKGYNANVKRISNINNAVNTQNCWNWGTVPHKMVDEIEDGVVELEEHPFNETEELRASLRANTNVLDFVHLYLSEGIFSLRVAETNRFARQFFANLGNEGTSNYSRKWEPVDINEMKRFIGVILLMGIIYKPTILLYWVKDEIFWTPSFSEIMARTLFQLILKFLHFNNNLDPEYDPHAEDRDRLHKVRSLIDLLRHQFRTVWYPGR